MANEVTTFTTMTNAPSKSLKENVADAIYTISPEDTVFMNMIGKGKADGIKEEWLEDADRAPAANAKAEEWDGTRAASSLPDRKFNYTCNRVLLAA